MSLFTAKPSMPSEVLPLIADVTCNVQPGYYGPVVYNPHTFGSMQPAGLVSDPHLVQLKKGIVGVAGRMNEATPVQVRLTDSNLAVVDFNFRPFGEYHFTEYFRRPVLATTVADLERSRPADDEQGIVAYAASLAIFQVLNGTPDRHAEARFENAAMLHELAVMIAEQNSARAE